MTVLVASRTVPPLAISAYSFALACPLAARTARIAAVKVVLPWSMCPMVPTLTCGFVRTKVSLAIATPVVSLVVVGVVGMGPTRPPRDTLRPAGAGPGRASARPVWSGSTRQSLRQHGPESCHWDSNPGPRPYQGRALPTEPWQRDFVRSRAVQGSFGLVWEGFAARQLGCVRDGAFELAGSRSTPGSRPGPAPLRSSHRGAVRRPPRAGDGNRTHVACLEGRGSTIELHPRRAPSDFRHAAADRNGVEGGVRHANLC